MTQKEEIIQGVILGIEYGYGMKFMDPEHLYLKLEIQQFDGEISLQLFKAEQVGKLLLQFKGDYRGDLSINHLKHRNIFLLKSDSTNGVPNAIARLPPNKYPQYSWIYNDNWD